MSGEDETPSLRDEIALITGGASGIGLAMAHRFANAGMKLVLVDIEAGPLEEAALELRAQNAEVHTRVVDVSNADAMDALAADVADQIGRVHLLCNNAGVGAAGLTWELTRADWEFTMGANLWGVIHGIRNFVPAMVKANAGHVVNTASMAGLVSVPSMANYNATKHAVVTISETMYGELALTPGNRVGVSVLCPGFVRTRIWESERNRPEALRDTAAAGANAGQRNAMIKALVDNGIAAEDVAERVYQAVVKREFYILTHENTVPGLRRRADAIVDGGLPAVVDPRSLMPD